MKQQDKSLGMNRAISRRDFVEGSLKLASGLATSTLLPHGAQAGVTKTSHARIYYPPSKTRLRGSHEGAFEIAHQLALQGKRDWGPIEADEQKYDLVIVGAGISGLSAARFYKDQHPSARILILENHDDFGGHAKRNEFQLDGNTILGYGGSQSLEAPSAYSEVAKSLLVRIGVDVEELEDCYDQDFYKRHGLGPAIYFDKFTYGEDKLVRSEFFDPSLFLPLANTGVDALAAVDQMPLSERAKSQLKSLIGNTADRLPQHSVFKEPGYLQTISYQQFIEKHHGVTEPEVINLLKHLTNSYMGHGTDVVPALEALGFGLPGLAGTSLGSFEGIIRSAIAWSVEPYFYHFPDGNASVARLLVSSLIPGVASVRTMTEVVGARYNYANLDANSSDVRLRLNSTVTHVTHNGDVSSAKEVHVTYVRQGVARQVTAKKVVMACYNMAIPHICPEMPAPQKQALSRLVKIPLVYTNVLLNNWNSFADLGVGMLYSPGSWHKTAMLDFPVDVGSYKFSQTPDDPIVLHMNRSVTGTAGTPEEQSRAGRYELLAKSFDSFEREIRTQLAGALGKSNFDPARDIAGITVNRWPHGYAWNPNPLFNEDADKPHEVGRKIFGRIAIANSDAGARAYLDAAIDEAWRAVGELSS